MCISLPPSVADVPLNDFIGHFEGLTYSRNELIRNHERLKRTISGKRHIEFKFTALNKCVCGVGECGCVCVWVCFTFVNVYVWGG